MNRELHSKKLSYFAKEIFTFVAHWRQIVS